MLRKRRSRSPIRDSISLNAFRYGVLGVSDVDVTFAFAMIGVFTLIAYFYAAHLLRSGTRLRT